MSVVSFHCAVRAYAEASASKSFGAFWVFRVSSSAVLKVEKEMQPNPSSSPCLPPFLPPPLPDLEKF